MSPDVYTVTPSAKVADVVSEMAKHKYGCAVVVESAKVVGVFTTTDAMRLLAMLLEQGS
jgi:acetoin utilization protein AcuB